VDIKTESEAYKRLKQDFERWHSIGWSEWILLNGNNVKNIPDFPGVYEIRIKDKEFSRLKGSTSIIYIGCTEKRGLKKRINGLVGGRHIAKERIKTIVKELQVEMEFRFLVDFGASQIEAELLREYQDLHLELPPCNHNVGKKKIREE
jgi:hypothetical protein